MRKGRGLLFIVAGLLLAALAAAMVYQSAQRAAQVQQQQPAVAPAAPVKKVYVVVADRDIPENVAITTKDVVTKEFPTEFAPEGAIAAPEFAVGKYTTSRIYKGQILVSPLLAETRKTSALAARLPDGKVAMAVNVNDAMNSLGALRAGDKVDILLTLDLSKGVASTQSGQRQGQTAQNEPLPPSLMSTQLTIQNAEILAIGLPAGDAPAAQGQTRADADAQTRAAQQASKTITFLLDHQDSVTLKFIKDSGGIMDIILRGPEDKRLVKTEAVTLDAIYQQFRFRFPEPLR